jgi:hypothetical protein
MMHAMGEGYMQRDAPSTCTCTCKACIMRCATCCFRHHPHPAGHIRVCRRPASPAPAGGAPDSGAHAPRFARCTSLPGSVRSSPGMRTARAWMNAALHCQVYDNEADVGAAVRDSGIPREEIFVTSKVWAYGGGVTAVAGLGSRSTRGLHGVQRARTRGPAPLLSRCFGKRAVQMRAGMLGCCCGACGHAAALHRVSRCWARRAELPSGRGRR